jgi:hypothetical protein
MTTALVVGIWILVGLLLAAAMFILGVRASDHFHSQHVFKWMREAGLALGHDSIRVDNRKMFVEHPAIAPVIALAVQLEINKAQNKGLAIKLEQEVRERRGAL